MKMTTDRRQIQLRLRRKLAAAAVALALAGSGLVAASSAAAVDTPWLDVTQTADGVFARWTVPDSAVTAAVGASSQVVVRGSFGPSDNWAQVNLPDRGDTFSEVIGPLDPGLYHYQMAADDVKYFADTTNSNTNEAQPTWRWFYVPGPDGYVTNDVPEGNGGQLHDLTYDSSVAGAERTAVVYTPPGYDATSTEPYPVLYLQHGGAQNFRDWTELGRAQQIFDNLTLTGEMEPTVVVMGNGNSDDFTAELLDNIVPASRASYNVSDDPAKMALAGLSRGGGQTATVLKEHPGAFAYLGTFGAGFGSTTDLDVDAINAGTELFRIYVGNQTDIAFNGVMSALPALDAAGVEYEFDGINPDYGHNWNHWQESLADFSKRMFRTVSDHGMSEGHLPAREPFTTPPTGTTPTPWVTEDGFVTFETSPEFFNAKTVTVWGNWGTSHNWTRVELAKRGDRWVATVGALQPGLYYYRLIVDRVPVKDSQNPTSVTSEPAWSTFFVPGDSARLLADAPEGEGGAVSTLTYQSGVANAERSAYVWTPAGYDANRQEPYPVLYLQHGSGQSFTDWIEMGRAKQILDNYSRDNMLVPMVVVMGNGNSPNFTAELLDNIVPASRQSYNVSSDPAEMALAGLSMGGGQTAGVLKSNPGVFRSIGIFSAGFGNVDGIDVDAINGGTDLLRLYTGNITDLAYNGVIGSLSALDAAGVEYEFDGVSEHGHNWDAWQKNLIDFLPRLFKAETSVGIPVEATVPEGEDGALVLTVADFGDAVSLSSPENAGDRLRFTGALPEVTVTDSRSAQQAGLGGWSVTGQAGAFMSTGQTVSSEHLGWAPQVLTPRAGLSAGPAVATLLDEGLGLKTPGLLASANAEGRFGSAKIGAGLILDVPVDTQPGTYTGVLTVSLFPVD